MRQPRLLNRRLSLEDHSRELGSAPVETVFAIVFLMFIVLGTVEVAFALYARNVVASSAHEGARAAIEVGRSSEEASQVAREIVYRAAGGLVRSLRVVTRTTADLTTTRARVIVTGNLRPLGPVPISIPLTASATVTGSARP